MMKISFFILSFLLSTQLAGQVLQVSDEQGRPLPYFTVSLENENKVLIGGKDGRISLEGLNNTLDCGFSIRYVGYRVHHFCLSDLEAGENKIVLEPEVLDLPQVTIVGLTDQELILRLKSYLAEMSDRFTVAKAFVTEKSDHFHWESLGVITLWGLQDRSNKNSRFDGGNLGFLSQYSRLWIENDNQLPFRSRLAASSTLTQDLLFEILKSKVKDWIRVNEAGSTKEIFKLVSQNLMVYLNQNGTPEKILIEKREFRDPKGVTYQIAGQLDFIQDEKVSFFSAFNFEVQDQHQVSISGVIPDFPKVINLPEKYKDRSQRGRVVNAFYAYTGSPDYLYDEAKFRRSVESKTFNYTPKIGKNLNLLARNYTQAELFKGKDPATQRYLLQNSEFIRGVLKSFEDYELTW